MGGVRRSSLEELHAGDVRRGCKLIVRTRGRLFQVRTLRALVFAAGATPCIIAMGKEGRITSADWSTAARRRLGNSPPTALTPILYNRTRLPNLPNQQFLLNEFQQSTGYPPFRNRVLLRTLCPVGSAFLLMMFD